MDYRKPHLPLALAALLVLSSSHAAAQQPPAPAPGSLAALLRAGFIVVDEDFDISVDPAVAAALNTAIARQVASYPVGTSSGGFTYSFDQALGVPRRSTRSFGPAFAKRALTIGSRNVSVGVNVQHAAFTSFEGHDLENLRLQDAPFFEGALVLHLKTDTTAFVAEVGVSPRLDVGVVVPFVRVELDATVENRWKDPDSPLVFRRRNRGVAAGLGDVVVTAKYNFVQRAGGGLAAAADLRLPTGDQDNLRGTDHAQLKMFLVGSAELGPWAPHVNAGVTVPVMRLAFPLTTALGSWQIDYSGGVDLIAGARLTITGDIVGRAQTATPRFGDQRESGSLGRTFFTLLSTGTMHQLLGAVGAKINVHRTLLLTASVLVPMNGAGLTSRIATVIGADYAF